MMRLFLCVALSAVCGAGMAWADESPSASPEAARTLWLARARAAQVPSTPVLRKLDEGIAKGVPLDRIEPVLAALVDRLKTAQAICSGWSPASRCTMAAADALLVGVTRAALEEIAHPVPAADETRARLKTIFAVSDLRAKGLLARQSLPTVRRLADTSLSVPDIVRAALKSVDQQSNALDGVDREGNFRAVKGRADPPGRALGHDKPPGQPANPGQGQGRGPKK
jgi:hypothetical protein